MPTNETTGSIVQTGVGAADASGGVGQVLNTMNNLQAQQDKHQQLQQQLTEAQWNSTKGLLNTYMNASDPVRKALKKQLGPRLTQNGADPLILNALDDEDTEANTRLAMDSMNADPDQAAKGMAAVRSHDVFASSTATLADMIKQRSQQQIARAVAEINKSGRIGAATIFGGENSPRAMNTALSANNQYTKEVGPAEKAVYSANRATEILDKINEGSLKSTKTLAADLNSAVASLLAGGRPSTVFGQQATHQDDLYERIQQTKQFLTANPEDTQAPAKLNQLKLDVAALRDYYDEQHQQQYTAWRQGVPDKLKDRLDQRFQTFRKAQGMDPGLGEPQQTQPAPQGATSGAGGTQGLPPGLTPNQQSYVQKAVSMGLKQQDALARMKQKGIE